MEEGDGSPDDLMRANTSEDPRYFSVCVERIGFAPISLDEVRQRAKERLTPVVQLSPPEEKL
jgi:hypothetical protein